MSLVAAPESLPVPATKLSFVDAPMSPLEIDYEQFLEPAFMFSFGSDTMYIFAPDYESALKIALESRGVETAPESRGVKRPCDETDDQPNAKRAKTEDAGERRMTRARAKALREHADSSH